MMALSDMAIAASCLNAMLCPLIWFLVKSDLPPGFWFPWTFTTLSKCWTLARSTGSGMVGVASPSQRGSQNLLQQQWNWMEMSLLLSLFVFNKPVTVSMATNWMVNSLLPDVAQPLDGFHILDIGFQKAVQSCRLDLSPRSQVNFGDPSRASEMLESVFFCLTMSFHSPLICGNSRLTFLSALAVSMVAGGGATHCTAPWMWMWMLGFVFTSPWSVVRAAVSWVMQLRFMARSCLLDKQ